MFNLIQQFGNRLMLLKILIVLITFSNLCNNVQGHDVPKEPALPTERQSDKCLLTEGFFTCNDHSKCLHLDHVCDGIKDCQDNSDEIGKCSVKCSEAMCAGKCHPTPQGPYCLCPPGRKLSRDNTTCVDIDECRLWPPVCDQFCENTDGSYICKCAAGYELSEDQLHCYASLTQPGKAVLIYTQESSILMLHVGHGASALSPTVIYHARSPIFSLALDTVEERIFWFSSEDHEIKAIGFSEDFNKNTVQRIVQNGLLMVNTMAYDWIGKNLYIGDALLHRIIICNVDTHLCTTMFTSNVLHVPRSLVVDPSTGKLYWSECGRSKKIESSSLDGTNTITLVHDDVYCPNSLYIDLPIKLLYWTDPEMHLLESVSAIDGTNRRKYLSKYISNPVQLAIFEEEIYVAYKDKTTEKVLLAVSNKYKYDSSHQLLQLSDIPADMHVYHTATQMPNDKNPCDKKPCLGGLCVLTDRLSYKCLCPLGKRLDVSQHNCVWNLTMPSLLVASGNRLLRVLPDSVGDVSHDVTTLTSDHNISALAYDYATHTVYFAVTVVMSRTRYTSLNSFRLSESNEVNKIFQGVGWITDISVDWVSRNIYWCDAQQGVIEMARIDGTSRTVILNSEQIQEPNALVVDPMEGKLYYSDCGPAPHVGVCDLDGTNCYIQSLGSGVKCVSDLFIDQTARQLYWTDSTLGLISTTDLHHFSAHEIRHSPAPVGITVFGNDLFWLDTHYSDILRQPKTDSYHDTRIKLNAKPLTDLVSLHPTVQPTGNNGCSGVSYGGCSHLCIAKSRLQSVCMCPAGFQLSNNQKTCIQQSNTPQNNIVHVPTSAEDGTGRGNIIPDTPSKPTVFHTPIQPPNRWDTPIDRGFVAPTDRMERPGAFPDRLATPPSSWGGSDTAPESEVSKSGAEGAVPQPPIYYRCPPGLCVHSSQCLYKHHQHFCVCEAGWSGKHCEVRIGYPLEDGDDDEYTSEVTSGQSRGGLIAGLIIFFIIVILVIAGVLIVFRTHRSLRPGEVFSFMKLRYGVLRKTGDPKLETLINPACTDIVDNIYTDVNDIIEHNHRRKIKPPSLTHSQSLDSVQSACGTAKFP